MATTIREARRTLDARLSNDSELEGFLLSYFPRIHARLGGGMDRVAKLNLLFTLAEPDDVLHALNEEYSNGTEPALAMTATSSPARSKARPVAKSSSFRGSRTLGDYAKIALGLIILVGAILNGLSLWLPALWRPISALSIIRLSPTQVVLWAGAWACCAIWALSSGLARRSQLVRPEVFSLSADDASHLQGRDEDIERLVRLCQEHAQINLVGESGAGKSALLRTGLCPRLRDENLRWPMLPIYVDVWGQHPERGPRVALCSALWLALSSSGRQQLGLRQPPSPDELSTLLVKLQSRLGLIPFCIFDQFDDYQVRHLGLFLSEGTWLSPEELIRQNEFWAEIQALLDRGVVRCLFATRNDTADGLASVHFADTIATYRLDRLKAGVVSHFLDVLTTPSADEVSPIQNATRGWDLLRARLVHDLEETGAVLPAQMKIALQGLSQLSSLTIAAYERQGGLRGLEAAHIQWQIGSTARLAEQPEERVRSVLLSMVDSELLKTRPQTSESLCVTCDDESSSGKSLRAKCLDVILDDLSQKGLLRRRIDPDSANHVWVLDHDYLCLGIIEISRRANHWHALAQERFHSFQQAYTLWRRWRALLPIWLQCVLLWQRLRKRIQYGTLRQFAAYSLAGTLPYILLAMLAGSATRLWMADQTANKLLSEITHLDPNMIYAEEQETLWRLANSDKSVRERFLINASRSSNKKLSEMTDVLFLSAAGLGREGVDVLFTQADAESHGNREFYRSLYGTLDYWKYIINSYDAASVVNHITSISDEFCNPRTHYHLTQPYCEKELYPVTIPLVLQLANKAGSQNPKRLIRDLLHLQEVAPGSKADLENEIATLSINIPTVREMVRDLRKQVDDDKSRQIENFKRDCSGTLPASDLDGLALDVLLDLSLRCIDLGNLSSINQIGKVLRRKEKLKFESSIIAEKCNLLVMRTKTLARGTGKMDPLVLDFILSLAQMVSTSIQHDYIDYVFEQCGKNISACSVLDSTAKGLATLLSPEDASKFLALALQKCSLDARCLEGHESDGLVELFKKLAPEEQHRVVYSSTIPIAIRRNLMAIVPTLAEQFLAQEIQALILKPESSTFDVKCLTIARLLSSLSRKPSSISFATKIANWSVGYYDKSVNLESGLISDIHSWHVEDLLKSTLKHVEQNTISKIFYVLYRKFNDHSLLEHDRKPVEQILYTLFSKLPADDIVFIVNDTIKNPSIGKWQFDIENHACRDSECDDTFQAIANSLTRQDAIVWIQYLIANNKHMSKKAIEKLSKKLSADDKCRFIDKYVLSMILINVENHEFPPDSMFIKHYNEVVGALHKIDEIMSNYQGSPNCSLREADIQRGVDWVFRVCTDRAIHFRCPTSALAMFSLLDSSHAPQLLERLMPTIHYVSQARYDPDAEFRASIIRKLQLSGNIQTLIDYLKWPLAVGHVRQALLDQIERQSGRQFDGSLWKMVQWAEESGYDTHSPPRRHR